MNQKSGDLPSLSLDLVQFWIFESFQSKEKKVELRTKAIEV